MERQLRRKAMFFKYGKNMRHAWQQAQIKKYGYKQWTFGMRIPCDPRGRQPGALYALVSGRG